MVAGGVRTSICHMLLLRFLAYDMTMIAPRHCQCCLSLPRHSAILLLGSHNVETLRPSAQPEAKFRSYNAGHGITSQCKLTPFIMCWEHLQQHLHCEYKHVYAFCHPSWCE